MPKSAGDENGPRRKRRVRRKAKVSAAPLDSRPMPLSFREIVDGSTETIWSGTLEFQNGPHSNEQRQDVGIISGKIHSDRRINTINWSKQLKMTNLTGNDHEKLFSLGVLTHIRLCIFSVDDDCDKKSLGAFDQYTCTCLPHTVGYALLKYTSFAIKLLSLTSKSLQGEKIIVGHIEKFSNNDRNVKFLTDLGILPHATACNDLTKQNAMLTEELQQKDKLLGEQQKCHREEVEMLNTKMREEEAMMEKEKDEMQRERDVMQNQILERERTIYQTVSALKESLKKKDEKLQEKDEAVSVRESNLVEIYTELMEKDDRIMTINQDKEDLQRKNDEMQATLDALKQEFTCVICREMINKALTLKCGHSFCAECIVTLVIHRTERSTHHEEVHVPCPYCREQLDTIGPSTVIDSCIEKIKESRLGDRTDMENEGEPMSEGSDDESSSASSPSSSGSSSGSSSSSFSRNPSSIENMLSPASSSDSD